MTRITLDTDAVNRLADTPGLLDAAVRAHARGALVFVDTHIVGDQLAETPDAERRARLLDTWSAMPKVSVPTHGAVWNLSRWDKATWGDGADSGVTVPTMRTEGRGGLHDALIATTAAGAADVLVTNDDALAKRVRAAQVSCAVWSFGRLKGFIRAMARPG
jgi:hypothetical protein